MTKHTENPAQRAADVSEHEEKLAREAGNHEGAREVYFDTYTTSLRAFAGRPDEFCALND